MSGISRPLQVDSRTVTNQLRDRQLAAGRKILANRSARQQTLVLPGGKWTPHDLRRTGATMMTALGVLPEVAERCLNHIEENRLKRIYQRHNYRAEMTNAWEVLGKRLQELTMDTPGPVSDTEPPADCDADADGTSQILIQPRAGEPASELLTLAEVAKALKIGRTGCFELRRRDPNFPKPITNGSNPRSRVYFVRQEIEAYLRLPR